MAVDSMVYQLSVHSISDIGLVRQNNEDAIRFLPDEPFFVLADGMGGHLAGEVASREAVDRLSALFHDNISLFHGKPEEALQCLKKMIIQVNRDIYHLAKKHVAYKGMGTTLCCLYFHPEGLLCAHVGDSRIYRLRCGKLQQLTKDHSLLRELIDLGQLSEQQAGEFLYKNIITRAIGTEGDVEPSVCLLPIEEGDIYLMCSDGLSDLVPMPLMEEILTTTSEDKAVAKLVERAKSNGGYDNISIVTVQVKKIHATHLSRS